MKKVNPLKLVKVVFLVIIILILIYYPDYILNVINNIITFMVNYITSHSVREVGITIAILVVLYILAKTILTKQYYKIKLKYTNLKVNTYSKGHAKFQKKEDLVKNFEMVDLENNNTDGYLIAQYDMYIPKNDILKKAVGPKLEIPFEVTESKRKLADVTEGELSNEEQVALLKRKEKKVKQSPIKQLYYNSFCYSQKIAFLDTNPIHSLVIATTRAGKTQTIILPQISLLSSIKDPKKKPNMIMTDPKGEIFENTQLECTVNGYEVLVLNLKDFNSSHSYNPLEIVKVKHMETLELANERQLTEVKRYKVDILESNELKNLCDEEHAMLIAKLVKSSPEYFEYKLNNFIDNLDTDNQLENEINIFLRSKLKDYDFGLNKLLIIQQVRAIVVTTIGNNSFADNKINERNIKLLKQLDKDLEMIINEERPLENLENLMQEFKESFVLDEKVLNSIINIYEKYYVEELSKISFATAETELTKLSTYLIKEPEKDPTWAQGAKGIFRAYVKVLFERCLMFDKLDTAFNMYSVLVETKLGGELVPTKGGNDSDSELTNMKACLELRNKTHFAKTNHPDSFHGKTYNSYMGTLNGELEVFKNEDIGMLSSRHQFDFHKIVSGDKPYAIYLITPDYDTTFNVFVSTFISQLYLTAVEDAEKLYGGKLPRKMHFILDEFANVPKIDQLTNKLTVCLGRGIQFMMVIQNFTQLKDVYGEETTETILDNTHNKHFLLAGTYDTNELFSKQLGDTTILAESYSGKEYDEMSKTVSEEQVPLVTPYELNQNPLGQVYIASVKNDPLKVNLRPAFKYLQRRKTTEKKFFNSEENMHSSIKNVREITL